MKNKKYTFGDVTFEVEIPVALSDRDNCEAFLSDCGTDILIRAAVTEADRLPEKKAERNGCVITRYLSAKHAKGMSIASLLASSDAAFVFPEYDAFILHAAYIIHEGRALLFTAPSGTGKSTQAEFWRAERGAETVNGDRVLVTRRGGQYYANGIYASGTSGISKNITAPIGAVVLLEQSESNVQRVIPARQLFLRILCECSYDMKDRAQYEKITELVSGMINTVPVLCYGCRKHPDAVAALERILSWKET